MFTVGIGTSTSSNTAHAAKEATSQALATCSQPVACAFLFAGPQHDPALLVQEVQALIGGDCVLIGGSSTGIISNQTLSYTGSEVGVALLSGDEFAVSALLTKPITGREELSGSELGKQLQQIMPQASGLLVLYDSVARTSQQGPPQLNLATPLIEGLLQGLGAMQPTIAGVGLMADAFISHPCHEWTQSGVQEQAAIALAIGGGLTMDTLTLHGCRPMGSYHTITKAEANVIFEIDGVRAIDRILELLGTDSPYQPKDFPLFITLGVNRGDPFATFREEHYANRLCFAVDEEHGALIMFEPDLKVGDKVQLMGRSIDLAYVRKNIDAYLLQDKNNPVFAFYIDCLGRAAAYCGMEREDATEVQIAMNDRSIPLLGIYSGVEIAKVGHIVQALDWTGVLCFFRAS